MEVKQGMDWKKLLASITESVDEELRLRNEYLATENRLLRQQINGRVYLTDSDRKVLAEIGQQLGKKALKELATLPNLTLSSPGTARSSTKRVRAPSHVNRSAILVLRRRSKTWWCGWPTRTTRGATTARWALWLTWTIGSATKPWVISSSVTAFLSLRNAHTP
jgi:hypothetical protein